LIDISGRKIVMKTYRTIFKNEEEEIIINKSRFIGYSSFVENEEQAQAFIQKIKEKHRDATHNVYAYIIGENFNIQRYSDDGEPSGTAGIPMLNYLKSIEITNIVVVCTRYFGGIKLGTGGLARAYSKSAKSVVEKSKIVESKPFNEVNIELDYGILGKIENYIQNAKLYIKNKNFEEKVIITLLLPDEELETTTKEFIDISSNTIKIENAKRENYFYDGKEIMIQEV
jgi:uncharacterized YigZ family protein